MARGVNKVILVGNLGRDPEIRYGANDRAFGTLNVATTEQWYSREKGETQENTQWHRVRVFAGLAETAERYLHRGDRVYIEGRLETRDYEKDGETRYVTEIVAREMIMLGGRGDRGDDAPPPSRSRSGPARERGGGGAERSRPAADKAPDASGGGAQSSGDSDFEDDLPF